MPQESQVRLLSVRRIWDQAPHNAFTDLTRFDGRFYCVFREATVHGVEAGGAVRILISEDLECWTCAGLFALPGWDLRDPKITVTPDERLMVTAGARRPPDMRNFVWFSDDGEVFGPGQEFAEAGAWSWRVTWHKSMAYTVSRGVDREASTRGEHFIRLHRSGDGVDYEVLIEQLFVGGYPNEATLVFLDDDTGLCLLRREEEDCAAQLGTAQPPYVDWCWQKLSERQGGPNMAVLSDGRLIAGGRKYRGDIYRTALWEVGRSSGGLRELLELPSAGDNSYPGFLWHDGTLYVSYYSSHEEKTSIYLARIAL